LEEVRERKINKIIRKLKNTRQMRKKVGLGCWLGEQMILGKRETSLLERTKKLEELLLFH